MNRRLALRLAMVALVAFLVAPLGLNESAGAQSTLPNPQTGMLPDPPLPDGVTYSYANSQSFFGTPCCIRTQSVAQGALGDCFFISALDALAMTSPGTIENAIHYNPVSNTFTLAFYVPPPGAAASSNAAWVRHTYTTDAQVPVEDFTNRLGNVVLPQLFNSTFPWVHPVDALTAALSTERQPLYVSSPNSALWPLLLEKGYAATQPDGYNSLTHGGFGKVALHALTGATSEQWVLPDISQRLQVTVKNMPSVSDLNGHCIICGFFDGRGLTAVEPDIQVCASPVTLKPATAYETCTPTCKPGHECTALFPSNVQLGFSNASLMVSVFDAPPNAKRTEIALFKKDPGQCMAQSPCQQQPLDTLNLGEAPVQPLSISFQAAPASEAQFMDMPNDDGTTSRVKTLPTLDAIAQQLAQLTNASTGLPIRPVLAGTIQNCPWLMRCVGQNNPVFAQGGLVAGHEYYLKKYIPNGDPTKAKVVFGNPWGSSQDVTFSLILFQYSFFQMSTNDVTPVQASASCSCK